MVGRENERIIDGGCGKVKVKDALMMESLKNRRMKRGKIGGKNDLKISITFSNELFMCPGYYCDFTDFPFSQQPY